MRASLKEHLKQPWRFKDGVAEKPTSRLTSGKRGELVGPGKGAQEKRREKRGPQTGPTGPEK